MISPFFKALIANSSLVVLYSASNTFPKCPLPNTLTHLNWSMDMVELRDLLLLVRKKEKKLSWIYFPFLINISCTYKIYMLVDWPSMAVKARKVVLSLRTLRWSYSLFSSNWRVLIYRTKQSYGIAPDSGRQTINLGLIVNEIIRTMLLLPREFPLW